MAHITANTTDRVDAPFASLSSASSSDASLASFILPPTITTDLSSLSPVSLDVDTSATSPPIPTPVISSTPLASTTPPPIQTSTTSILSVSTTTPPPPPTPAATSSSISSTSPTSVLSTSSIPTSTSSSLSSPSSVSSAETSTIATDPTTSTTTTSTSTSTATSTLQSITTLVKSTTSSSSTTTSLPTLLSTPTKTGLTLPDKVGIGVVSIFGTIFLIIFIWFLTSNYLKKRRFNKAREEAHATEEAFAIRKRESDLERWKQGGPVPDVMVSPVDEPKSPIRMRASTRLEPVTE